MNVKFKTATDFRRSLDARLQARSAKTGEDMQRLRRKVAFDRFLARIFHQDSPGFYLKGGYAMELRIAHARATKDIDLTCIRRITNEGELLGELIWRDLQYRRKRVSILRARTIATPTADSFLSQSRIRVEKDRGDREEK